MRPLRHHAHAVGHRHRLFLVVRDEDRRDRETLLQCADLIAQLGAHLRVQRGKRLVEQEHAGLDGEGAREGDALLLAARQLMGILGHVIGQTHELQQFAGLGSALRGSAGDESGGRRRRCRGRSCSETRSSSERPFPCCDAGPGPWETSLPSTSIAADVGTLEAREHAQRGRLAAARGAEQRDQFTGRDVE